MHSPSLPNIWFPPHSGPIPAQFEEICRAPLQRPSTPTFNETDEEEINETSSSPIKLIPQSPEQLLFDDLTLQLADTQPLKIMRRRKLEREQAHGHSLLTPPLTPSSSLKTSASLDSAGTTDAKLDSTREFHGDEVDDQSTRFLLLSNISRQIPHDTLRAAIVGSLTSCVEAPQTSDSLSIPTSGLQIGHLAEDSIKGVYLRCQQSNGIAMLAFFDVRHSKIAKQIISTPTTGHLSHCVGEQLEENGTRTWIGCRFITAEELVKVIGNSAFLASTDGSFYIAVEGKGIGACDYGRELRVSDDCSVSNCNSTEKVVDQASENATLVADGELNLSMLKSFLKSFGGLRSFSLMIDKLDVKQPPGKVFRVEYYDVREAISAYSSIDGQVLFGMTLKVFGRDDISDTGHTRSQNRDPSHIQPSHDVEEFTKNRIPFPTSSGEHPVETGPSHFGPPGHYSHTRERLLYFEDHHARPRSVSAGQEVSISTIIRSPVPSPTYFYTSDPVEMAAVVGLSPEHVNHSGTEDGYVGHTDVSRGFVSDGRDWPREATIYPNVAPGPYPPHSHDCYYCPSRSIPRSTVTNECYVPCTTPSPYCYQPNQPLAHQQNAGFPTSAPTFTYDYEHYYPQPVSPNPTLNVVHVAPQHAMMGMPHPFLGETWFTEPPTSAPHVQYRGLASPTTGAPHYAMNKHDMGLADLAELPAAFNKTLQVSSQHPSRAPRTTPPQRSAYAREPRVPTEHNQLNLSRIEGGGDTRTTVMIKNIPNKMSDKDLITFIGKVCPRKIDFLYLRMDFQNGCNVGYAFVNFITVEDLLVFAKNKLGEKWNMFSSEKVLQMSYANYQGKEALVEKFKNSCIMDEQEAWRPKIFYSEPGPEQGLPEPFPAPTHLRRKERSAYNRGALYVPSIGRGTSAPQSIAHSRRLEDSRRDKDRSGQGSDQATPGHYPLVGTPRRRTHTKLWGGSQLG
ncbi:hypothetical protein H0H81_000803 [Sphagnurus paluster]|uniref:RRM domain-containing protein n=1 Tax=Sphagnurus paluster TaxID=117069 RepID=A0A9P7FMW7_9AGAR|nr:hypothetical protein H0H81_000803 [Sphagnurus paluster]